MIVYTVIGARPQFVKASVVSQVMRTRGIRETLIHTGQHYDLNMSRIFFDELNIPEPAVNLEVGSGSHAYQIGEIMIRLEKFLRNQPFPDWILVYGDTNSTLAGALVAEKSQMKLAHVEAGMRSFNRRMPEESNRLVTDHLSHLLLCPTETAVENLKNEGIKSGVYLTGDVMFDAIRFFAGKAEKIAPLESICDYRSGSFSIATIHRAENTDDSERLAAIMEGLGRVGHPILLPLHPRTRAHLDEVNIPLNIEILEPVSYMKMLTLVRNARRVFTDSGGLQKEALWLGIPCVTLREETEWTETLVGGWNQIVGADAEKIASAAEYIPVGMPPFASEGAADRVVDALLNFPAHDIP